MVEEIYKHLTKDLIPFWNGMKDNEYGGFYGWLDYDLKLDKKAVKGCILNSRILWFYSNAYLILKEEALLACAKHAYMFLIDHCLDKVNGGVFWSVYYDGSVHEESKHTYNQAFAIYALSSYYDATKDEKALQVAMEIYQLIETKCRDSVGYLEAFNERFEPVENVKLSENGIIAEKTMNTLLHIFEAYTELYRVTKKSEIADKLRFIMDCFAEKVYNPKLHRQEVYFDKDMNSLIDVHSYGHDIETTWLIDRGFEVINDKKYAEKMLPITKDLAREIYCRAYQNHSVLNECVNGLDNTSRIWWVQAEGIVGFYNAYEKTNELHYLEAAKDIWNYVKEYVIDKRNGSEWYWEVDENGVPSSKKPIVEPWKCPYHNGRMCFEMIRRSDYVAS